SDCRACQRRQDPRAGQGDAPDARLRRELRLDERPVDHRDVHRRGVQRSLGQSPDFGIPHRCSDGRSPKNIETVTHPFAQLRLRLPTAAAIIAIAALPRPGAAQSPMWAGSWILNLSKSTYAPEPPPLKRATRRITVTGDRIAIADEMVG